MHYTTRTGNILCDPLFVMHTRVHDTITCAVLHRVRTFRRDRWRILYLNSRGVRKKTRSHVDVLYVITAHDNFFRCVWERISTEMNVSPRRREIVVGNSNIPDIIQQSRTISQSLRLFVTKNPVRGVYLLNNTIVTGSRYSLVLMIT